MNRIATVLFSALMLIACSTFAQSDTLANEDDVIITDNGRDSLEISFGSRTIIIAGKDSNEKRNVVIKKNEKREERRERSRSDISIVGLDLGWNNYYNGGLGLGDGPEELELNAWRSAHVALHLLPTRVGLNKKGSVNLKTAITFNWNNYRFDNDDVVVTADQENFTIATTGEGQQKSKLVATSVQLPLLLNFQTNPGYRKKNVSFSIGGYGGLLINGKTKIVDSDDDKIKEKDQFNLNRLRYGVTARLDFRWFDFYVNYNISSLFAENEGPQINTFEAGINVINF